MVSIIMPSYNKAKFISEAIESIISQTFDNWELLIVDDLSEDSTRSVLEKYSDNKKIRIFYEKEKKGANHCRNFGLGRAIHDYVLFFDADDIMTKDCLKNRVEKISKEQPFDFIVFQASQFVYTTTNVVNVLNPAPVSVDLVKELLALSHSWQTSQLLWNKKFIQKIGGFDTAFTRFQDIEIHTRAVLMHQPVYRFVEGESDIFIRLTNDRLTMTHFELCSRTIKSIVQYCTKFQDVTIQKYGKPVYLGSLIYGMGVINAYKNNNAITPAQFDELSALILNNTDIRKMNWWNKRKIKKVMR